MHDSQFWLGPKASAVPRPFLRLVCDYLFGCRGRVCRLLCGRGPGTVARAWRWAGVLALLMVACYLVQVYRAAVCSEQETAYIINEMVRH